MAEIGMNKGNAAARVRSVITAVILVGLLAVPAMMTLRGCDEKTGGDVQAAKIGGKTFFLEVVDDDAERMKGLGGRTHIEDNGGMLFVFTSARATHFVMRDCPIDIDILFLDPNGRVVAMHEMKAEAPRGPGEGQAGQISSDPDDPYEKRLKKYPSRFPSQFAIELKGGTLPTLKVKDGDKIELPLAELKKRAK